MRNLVKLAWIAGTTLMACGDVREVGPDASGAIDAAAPDAPGAGCGATGAGTTSGTVGGLTIGPVARVNSFGVGGGRTVIVLDEVAGACGETPTTGEHLVFGWCQAPAVGTYNLGPLSCPSNNALALIEQNGGEDFAGGESGTVTITARTATCVSGRFDVMMRAGSPPGPAERITGTFDALICP